MENRMLGLPAGFRDVLFDEARAKRRAETILADHFEAHGYRELSPSGIEFVDLYARGNQNIRDRVFKFLDRDDNLLGLRADFTPAIARIVAGQLAQTSLPVRAWYSGSVFRKVESHQGRFCEFGQIGAELVGANSFARDVEILDLAMSGLSSLGIGDVQLHVNHAGIFRGVVGDLSLDRASLRSVKEEIGRRNARGLAARLQEFGVPEEVQKQVSMLAGTVGGPDVLRDAGRVLSNPQSRQGLETLLQLFEGLGRWRAAVTFDLTEIDEMEYYTGVMFTLFSPRLSGELGKGGRYDALLKEFGADLPAVGFSFSMDRLVELA